MNTIHASIILDSINPDGVRLTTLVVNMPKFLVAQLNTHRRFSRNSASSRAITIGKNIEHMLVNPVTPADFGLPANGKGMQPKSMLTGTKAVMAKVVWKSAMYSMAGAAWLLSKIGLHKGWSNRLLEPFVYTSVLISATEWDNFLKLRTHGDAQDAMQAVANAIQEELTYSVPDTVPWGSWHLPYVGVIAEPTQEQFNVSISCCAQISFRSLDTSPEKAERVVKSLTGEVLHLSPMEHPAKAMPTYSFSNFHDGWMQYRKFTYGTDA
jgi:hypothetical protein